MVACDVCGRTLLRGERAHAYVDSGQRRAVCELCTSRALHEGWVREGTELQYDGGRGAADRRRSLLSRLRGRREPRVRELESELSDPAPRRRGRERPSLLERLRPHEPAQPADGYEEGEGQYAYEPAPAPAPVAAPRLREPAREPRHVRAIPTSAEQKFAAAIEVFNGSEHRRTVAGVARSLGAPTVAILPAEDRPGLVALTVSWELCWYRYEIDLSEDPPGVRVSAQGYELDELPELERRPNAVADENGALELAA